MPLVIVAIGVILLLLLMIRFKMNGFIALVLVALAVGLMQGMPLDKVIGSIKAGVGGTLGSLALIMGFGAMLGKMLADCGGAQRIATTLIAKFGKKHIQWAVVLTGVSPELMVIAVGSGSVIFSHVNDPGFWLFKEYFNLTIGETIKSWSMLETIISVCGLIGCLLLGMVV
ncbi:hypothetical protein APP84_02245 [Salmonella enterica subsp. enterica serovar Oranienburg]|uniref:GntT/GntP/DsdX family permease n=1 Tax=Salmonella enterica TaxID=28901 RepID=UPI00091D64FC|nr:hypothetical protein [Salmonella enterica]EAA7727327.1 hypothetical protein [Salmonella enterica subsp. enterica serovar Pomona]EAA8397823.1 hypothetical protein [Salmonella enterica subsp. enterica serovar Oranienburg]EAM4460204.1 hypothetical protein [Salmonella enterica subsp. enterica serovar Oranienburg]EAR0432187.1 hypothetical protein [Salmonella enterica subsp. enterica serovar Oranienburg]EAR3695019.1 hypothetical protein [Salmonella enterica]